MGKNYTPLILELRFFDEKRGTSLLDSGTSSQNGDFILIEIQ